MLRPGTVVVLARPLVIGGDLSPLLAMVTGSGMLAPWPRTVWPARSEAIDGRNAWPFTRASPLDDDALAALFAQRAEACRRRGAAVPGPASLDEAIRAARTGPLEPFGPDLAEADRLTARELPWRGVDPVDWFSSSTALMKLAGAPAAAVRALFARVWADRPELVAMIRQDGQD